MVSSAAGWNTAKMVLKYASSMWEQSLYIPADGRDFSNKMKQILLKKGS